LKEDIKLKKFICTDRLKVFWNDIDNNIYLLPSILLEKPSWGIAHNIIVFRFIKIYISFYFGPSWDND
jgi:hypothetical protein